MKPERAPEQSTCLHTHLLGSQERTDERPAESSSSAVPQAGLNLALPFNICVPSGKWRHPGSLSALLRRMGVPSS